MPPVDDGMIHAWLDGALSADEAARIEQLVASDPAWGAAAAEARGLIAASSRILASLDAVPAQVAPASIPTVSAARGQLRTARVEPRAPRRWRPQAWAAAATLVMAVGAGVLWRNTPAADRTVMPDAKHAVTAPSAVVAEAPAASPAAASSVATGERAGYASRPSPMATNAAKSDRADQVAVARLQAPASEPAAPAGRAPALAEGATMERAKVAKKSEDASKDLAMDARARENEGRVVAAGAAGGAPAVAAAPEPQPATPSASGAVADAKERTLATAPAQNAMKAAAPARDEAVGAAIGARRALAAPSPVTGCWTVRLSQYDPAPSFPVPVGAMLDSARTGSAQVARALVGSNAPTPAPGQWTTSGDSLRVTIDRVVLGYSLRVAVSLQTRLGRATLGDAASPAKASALAELQPSRCGAP